VGPFSSPGGTYAWTNHCYCLKAVWLLNSSFAPSGTDSGLLFELCTTDGILLDFLVYHGMMSRELAQVTGMMKSELIPVTLMQPCLNQGHRLFLDNYYTSPQLVQYFFEQGTKVVGTVCPNRRNFPRELGEADIERGQSKFTLSTCGVLAVKYRAKQDKSNRKLKVVCLLSTDHCNKVPLPPSQTKTGSQC